MNDIINKLFELAIIDAIVEWESPNSALLNGGWNKMVHLRFSERSLIQIAMTQTADWSRTDAYTICRPSLGQGIVKSDVMSDYLPFSWCQYTGSSSFPRRWLIDWLIGRFIVMVSQYKESRGFRKLIPHFLSSLGWEKVRNSAPEESKATFYERRNGDAHFEKFYNGWWFSRLKSFKEILKIKKFFLKIFKKI